jgi:hypothetical protein
MLLRYIALAAAVLVLLPASAAGQGSDRCKVPPRSAYVTGSDQLVVWQTNPAGDREPTVVSCVLRTGKKRTLDRLSLDLHLDEPGEIMVAGRWLLYELGGTNGESEVFWLDLMDAVTGKRANLDRGDGGDFYFWTDLALSRSGRVAWLAYDNDTPDLLATREIHTYGKKGERVVAAGPHLSDLVMSAGGRRLFWRDGETAMTAPFE